MTIVGRAKMVSSTLRSVEELALSGLLPRDTLALKPVAARFAVAITPEMAALIDESDAHDPIARQFVPSSEELVVAPEERADPIGDAAHSPVPGIVHRHADRVLFKPVLSCPVYCRDLLSAGAPPRRGDRHGPALSRSRGGRPARQSGHHRQGPAQPARRKIALPGREDAGKAQRAVSVEPHGSLRRQPRIPLSFPAEHCVSNARGREPRYRQP